MNPIIHHFVSGTAFFSGSLILIIACCIFFVKKIKPLEIIARFAAFVSFVIILFSATPLPKLYYAIWGLSVLACLIMELFHDYIKPNILIIVRIILILLSVVAICLEFPYRLKPQMPQKDYSKIYIIGDSISAGIGQRNELLWSDILRNKYDIDIINLAKAGATTHSAKKQLSKIHTPNSLIILEIGGNDLLNGFDAEKFTADLNELLSQANQTNNDLILFELPLLPFFNQYGAAQRTLAGTYNTTLIPKRYLADLLNQKNATLDGIHLSEMGHQKMADLVWQFIGHCFTNQLNKSI